MTTLRALGPQADMILQQTRPRTTAPGAGSQFREALGRGASSLLGAVEEAVALAPGGGALAAAVRSGRGQIDIGTSAASTSGQAMAGASEPGRLLEAQSSQAFELLEMQQQISMEQRQFQTVSNVMKARHDTSKAVIQNVR